MTRFCVQLATDEINKRDMVWWLVPATGRRPITHNAVGLVVFDRMND
jgi:hypothetical protein